MKYYKINELENKKIHGRTVKDACPLPLFWNHAGVEFDTDSSTVILDLEIDCDFHEPWVAMELNGALMMRQMLLPGRYELCLIRNTTLGARKNIKFFRELQAMSEDDRCHVLIHGVKADGNFYPVPDKKWKLEFIGDSITSGEGTYGAKQDTDWLAMYMSSSLHYANIIEHERDVETRIISQGGWGVYCGWDNDVRHNIPSVYEPICGLAYGKFNESLGANRPNDYTDWVPNAIIVNLGTNDASAFRQPPLDVPGFGMCKQRVNADGTYVAEDVQKVMDCVVAFLKMLRKNNPTSHIVWVYGMLGYDLQDYIIKAINVYKETTDDRNVAYLSLPDTNEETVGSHGHPGYLSHVAASKVLLEYLDKNVCI